MNYEIVKSVPQNETEELLGVAYFDRATPVLGWDKKTFIMKLNGYIFTGKSDSENQQNFFDMMIELTTLTLVLYKWGILLTNLKSGIFADMIFTVKFGNKRAYFAEEKGQILLRDFETGEEIYKVENYAKSQVAAILLYLYQQEGASVDMVEIESFDEKYVGNYLSFNQERSQEQKGYINYIDEEFKKYKTRLEDLQKIFMDNF